MVDTLHLETTNFEADNLEAFEQIYAKPPSRGQENVILGYTDSSRQEPVKGFYAKHSFLDKRNHRGQIDVIISKVGNDRKLSIKISSLPKLLYHHNLFCFDRTEEFESARSIIEKELESIGVTVHNFSAMQLVRVDLAFCIITENSVAKYVEMLKKSALPRMLKVVHKTGVEFKAEGKNYGIYDKGKQLKTIAQKLGPDNFPFQTRVHPDREEREAAKVRDRILRIELQFKNRGTVEKNLDVTTWQDLSSQIRSLREKFCKIAVLMIKNIRVPTAPLPDSSVTSTESHSTEQMKNPKTKEVFVDEKKLRKFVLNFREENGDKWFSNLVKFFGLVYINIHLRDALVPILRELLLETQKKDAYETQMHRIIKALDEAEPRLHEISSLFGGANELRALQAELFESLTAYSVAIVGDALNPFAPGESFSPYVMQSDEDFKKTLQREYAEDLGDAELSDDDFDVLYQRYMREKLKGERLKLPYGREFRVKREYQEKLAAEYADRELKRQKSIEEYNREFQQDT